MVCGAQRLPLCNWVIIFLTRGFLSIFLHQVRPIFFWQFWKPSVLTIVFLWGQGFGIMEEGGVTRVRWKIGALFCKAASLAALPVIWFPPYYAFYGILIIWTTTSLGFIRSSRTCVISSLWTISFFFTVNQILFSPNFFLIFCYVRLAIHYKMKF
jgi:hypothetical protein